MPSLLLWLSALQSGKGVKDLPIPDSAAGHILADDILLQQIDSSDPVPVAEDQAPAANTNPWVKWNQTQRNKTKVFALSNPVDVLVIGTVTIQLAVHILHVVERVASENYELQQNWDRLQGKAGKLRVHEFAGDHLQKQAWTLAAELLDSPSKYAALPQLSSTWRSQGLAFVLLSTTLAAMEHYLWRPWRQFPLVLFKLLDIDEDQDMVAQEILQLPVCLRDPWAARFLEKYHSKALLCSQEALAILYGIAVSLRFDIIALECRHAAVRRLQKKPI